MFEKNYWDQRYTLKETQWDTGRITEPIRAFVDQLFDKELKILIPGAGNSYEAEYLFKRGFKNVFVLDISEIPLKNLKKRVPDFPVKHLLHQNFFELAAHFDLILEQTFFCALDPSFRPDYAKKIYELLLPEGILAGVLFGVPLNKDKPPFGGSKEEYISYFRPWFDIKHLELCYNSIQPRAGRELFIELIRKNHTENKIFA